MSDLMREEFEQAVVNMHVSHGVPPEDAAAFLENESNGYRSVSTKSAWWAWQASRECLVIKPEWPDRYEFTNPDVAGSAILDCRSAFQKALIAAGVKYK